MGLKGLPILSAPSLVPGTQWLSEPNEGSTYLTDMLTPCERAAVTLSCTASVQHDAVSHTTTAAS